MTEVLTKTERIIFGVIIIVAAATRVYYLNHYSLWFDEAASLLYTHASFGGIIRLAEVDNTPPLYHLLLRIWVIPGSSDFWVRLLSATFGILSVWMTFKIGRLLFTVKVALVAAAIGAVSFQSVHFSQEARMYTMLAFFTLASIYFFILSLREGRPVHWVGYCLSSLLAFYTHIFVVFIFLAQWVYFLINFKEYGARWKGWLLTQVVLGLLMLPWISVIFQQVRAIGIDYWIAPASPREIVKVAIFLGGGTDWNNRYLLTALMNAPLAALFIIGMAYQLREGGRERFLVPVLFFIPLIVVYFWSLKHQSLFFKRYFFYLLPLAHFFIAFGLFKLSKRIRLFFAALLAPILLLFLGGYYANPKLSQGLRHDFKSMSKLIEEKIPPGATIIHLGVINAGLHSYFVNRWYTRDKYDDLVWREAPAPFYCGNHLMIPGDWFNSFDRFDSTDTLYVLANQVWGSKLDEAHLLRSGRKIYQKDSIIKVDLDSLWEELEKNGYNLDWLEEIDVLVLYRFIRQEG